MLTNRRKFLKSFGAVAAAVTGIGKTSQAAATGNHPEGMASKRPNVILIVSDEHRADACGCYGSAVRQIDGLSPTPAIDALAQSGVRFDSMYCPSPLCAPSRAAYMTGTYPHTTTALHHKMQRSEAGLDRLPGVLESIPGMGEYFQKSGYRTAAIGKMHVHGETVAGWDLGFDERALRFYTQAPGMHYADLQDGDINRRYREMPPYNDQKYRDIDPVRFARAAKDLKVKGNGVNQHFLETLVEHEDEMFDPMVTDRSIEFIEREAAGQNPFFIHVGLEKPHRPWTIHQSYLDRFNPSEIPLPETVASWKKKGMIPFVQQWCHSGVDGDEARNSIAAYYACALQVDDCVARIMARCEELGILDNTIIVYTSDHGESLFDHGLIEKHNMYDPAARVPFIIRAPWALPQNTSSNAPSNLIDIIPTLCEITGAPAGPQLEGESLVPAAHGKGDPDRIVFCEFYQGGGVLWPGLYNPIRMGASADYKYIYTHGAADQLYRRDDRTEAEFDNLAFDDSNEVIVSRMKLCTLADWELDEFPQMSATVRVTAKGVSLSWETAADGASYDVYRSVSGDPRKAQRIASGLAATTYDDTSAEAGKRYIYWVLGHPRATKPYQDNRGKRRFGNHPISVEKYAYRLPITPRMQVSVKDGWSADFAYQPLLPIAISGLPFVHIGAKPQVKGNLVQVSSPVTVLSAEALEGAYQFAADIRTVRPGYKPDQTLKIIFNYESMDRYHMVALLKDGRLVLSKRTGEWNVQELASVKHVRGKVTDWQALAVHVDQGHLQVYVEGQLVITHRDPEALLLGRCGFESPRNMPQAEIRNVSISRASA
jgi:arylsulfatase A-like enzyme